jgi:hypothetical protein
VTAQPFVYAVLRAVPRVDRGEFVNVGVILYAQQHEYLSVSVHVDAARVRALHPATDIDGLSEALHAVQDACSQGPVSTAREGGGLGAVFRWLTAPRSTVLQPGPVHAGVTADPAAELERLADRLVR